MNTSTLTVNGHPLPTWPADDQAALLRGMQASADQWAAEEAASDDKEDGTAELMHMHRMHTLMRQEIQAATLSGFLAAMPHDRSMTIA